MSSRNARLTDEGRNTALILYKALNHIKIANKSKSPQVLINEAKEIIAAVPEVELEYLAICETSTLHSASQFDPEKEYVVLVAAWLEGVRLIDNILL